MNKVHRKVHVSTRSIDIMCVRNPLPADTQKKLIELARRGSKEAQDQLVLTNMRFISSVSNDYYITDAYSKDELIAEGVAGLITAIYRYDFDRGVNFISYAVFWIRNGMSAYIANKTKFIRTPINLKDAPEFSYTSLNATLNGGDGTFEDTLEQTTYEHVDDTIGKKELTNKIEEMLNELPYDQAQVIRYRYGIGEEVISYDEMSEKMEIPRLRLLDLGQRGMVKLRKKLLYSPNRNDLLQYLQMAA